MEKVIQRLYDIETKAERIVQDASEEKKRLQEDSDQKIHEFDQSVAANTKERLDQLRAEIDSSLSKDREALETSCELQLQKREAFFTDSNDTLVDKILQKITGGVDYVQ